MLKLFFVFLVLVSMLNAAQVTRTKVLMGTFVSISLQEDKKEFIKPAFAIIKQIENAISSYAKNSPIYKLNHNKKAIIYKQTYEALRLSEKYFLQTDGYFNIAIGNITKDLYRFGEDERVPSAYELQNSNTSFSALKYNEISATLKEGVKIDLGGMGKGFAVDKAAKFLRDHELNATIAASGDIRCLGICKIEINNPFSQAPLVKFQTRDKDIAISTSGNYERFVSDKRNNHLINPKTKKSQENFTSVTLIAKPPNADLDAYATAVSVMPKAKAYKFLQERKIAYIILEADKKLVMSENLEALVKVYKPHTK